jgi:NADH:ubiquinone oxidoreductase subunit E
VWEWRRANQPHVHRLCPWFPVPDPAFPVYQSYSVLKRKDESRMRTLYCPSLSCTLYVHTAIVETHESEAGVQIAVRCRDIYLL